MHVLFMTVQISPTPAKEQILPVRHPITRPAIDSYGSGDEFSLNHWIDIRRTVQQDSAPADSADPDCADWT